MTTVKNISKFTFCVKPHMALIFIIISSAAVNITESQNHRTV